ncbi:monovalent cation:H+ antiporter, CPA1 (nhx1) [Borealophlyctis nickersoniae]|nr:monovalent cation:H+ antiporter, CPA1 (nhx1) [Borealophlyctis nickersoniae]
MSDTTPTPTIPSPSPSPTPDLAEELNATAWAILILISLLFIILLTSYYLQVKKIRFIHETVVSIVLGLVVGLAMRFSGVEAIQQMVSFNHRYFFNLLLPPIILNSGYDLKRKNFFRNFGSILTFAFLGTMISTLVIGLSIDVIIKFLNLTHWHPFESDIQMNLLDCIVFGAILSSTDPVTILAIFHQVRVDPKLYAIIFGESILNDSVAIVLFKTLGQFRGKDVSFGNLVQGIGTFLANFLGSVMVGVLIALICALMLKHSYLHKFPSLESCLITLTAYSTYLLSNGIQLSGIVSLLFCGITLKHYAYDNMSVRSRRTTKYMFRVLSQLSENFVFIYLGVAVFTQVDEVFVFGLVFFTLIICLIARYISVIPLAHMINAITLRMHPHSNRLEIPRNHQLMLWWAGLRGAIAFALSFEVTGPSAGLVRTTTLVICIVTVIMLGGTTNYALEKLKIRTGAGMKGVNVREDEDEGEGTDSSSEEEDWDDDLPGSRAHGTNGGLLGGGGSRAGGGGGERSSFDGSPSGSSDPLFDEEDHVGVDSRGVRGNSSWDDDMTHWFMSFDNRWLKPLFTRSRWRWGPPGGPRSRSPTRETLLGRSRDDVRGERRGSGRAFGVAPNNLQNRRGSGGGGTGFTSPRGAGSVTDVRRTGGGGAGGGNGSLANQNSPRNPRARTSPATSRAKLTTTSGGTPAIDASRAIIGRFGGQPPAEQPPPSPSGFSVNFTQSRLAPSKSPTPLPDDDEVFRDVNGDVWTSSPGRTRSPSARINARPQSPQSPASSATSIPPPPGTPGVELSGFHTAGGGGAARRGDRSGGSSSLNLFGLE